MRFTAKVPTGASTARDFHREDAKAQRWDREGAI
jgi:hypothetical protein